MRLLSCHGYMFCPNQAFWPLISLVEKHIFVSFQMAYCGGAQPTMKTKTIPVLGPVGAVLSLAR